MSEPRVFIILCTYNSVKTLEESVNSLLEQTYSNFSLLIINDGSTDNSSELIAKLKAKDQRIQVIAKENSGLGDSRNKGIEIAHEQGGEFIAFCDADDVWLPNKLALQMRLFSEQLDADVVVTDMIYYDKSENFQEDDELKYSKIDKIFEVLCKYNFTFQPVTAIVRTKLFVEYAKFTKDHSGQDFFPFLFFAYKKCHFYKVEKKLYRERQLEGSLQRSPNSLLLSGTARTFALRKLIIIEKKNQQLTPEELQITHEAHDRYCSWMLSGTRKSLTYTNAIREAWKNRGEFYSKKCFFKEMGKTLLYPAVNWYRT